jgi:predicted acyl esterase
VLPTIQTIAPAAADPRADQTMVPMSDRVRLATDVYLPERSKRSPVVLVRLPYDKSGRYTFMPTLAPWFNERGYVFVVQDVRGKFRSEGETMPYLHEVTDGYDTLDWIVRQPWSNGAIGMFGDSYYGWTQWAALASAHPALRAIVPRMTSADLGTIRVGTRWDRGIAPLYGASYFAHHWVDNHDYEFDVDWTTRPLANVFDGQFERIGRRSAAFDAMLRHDRDFVPFPDGHPFDGREVPTLHAVGWFDNIAPDSMRDYMMLQARGRALQYLVAASTDHENYALADAPIDSDHDHDVNDAALERLLPSYLGPALEFFDAFLRDAPVAEPPRVRWHLGHGGWESAERWPPPGVRPWHLYLDGGAQGTDNADGGQLSTRMPNAPGRARWVHDPVDLVPSTVENPFALLHELPDEAASHDREDVVTFTAEPVAHDLDLAGAVEARLAVSSTAPSIHVYSKLCDVAPSGVAHMLARGQTFVAHAEREGLVSVYLGHIGYRLRAGHRLRLHVASSDFPLYLPYPGDDRNPWSAASFASNGQTLHTGGSHPSLLTVHILGDPPV